MARGDFLRIFFEGQDVTWYVNFDHRVASRRFTKDNYGNLIVEYVDRDGYRLAVAEEVHPMSAYPYLEIRDKDGDLLNRVDVDYRVLSDPYFIIRDRLGSKLEERSMSPREMDMIMEDYNLANGQIKGVVTHGSGSTGSSGGETGGGGGSTVVSHGDSGSANYNSAVPAVLCVLMLLALGLCFIFGRLYEHLDTITHYAGLLFVYGSCPLMVLLYLLVCRTGKKPSAGLRAFHLASLLLFAAGFGFLAWLNSIFYYGADMGFIGRMGSDDAIGWSLILLGFAPVAVYGLISGILTLALRKTKSAVICERLSRSSMQLMSIGNLVMVLVTQLVMNFAEAYGPNSLNSIFSAVVLLVMLTVLLSLVWLIAKLPYRLLSRFF